MGNRQVLDPFARDPHLVQRLPGLRDATLLPTSTRQFPNFPAGASSFLATASSGRLELGLGAGDGL